MNLLITGAFRPTESQKKSIEALGYNIIEMPQEKDSLPINADEVDAVVCNGLFLYHNIDEFSNLKFIQLTSAGLDRVPLNEIKKKGISLYNARGVYSIPMAEWALMAVLSNYKSYKQVVENKQKKVWEKQRNVRELYGKRVAILGAGNVGRSTACAFNGVGAMVDGFDINTDMYVGFDNLHHITKLRKLIGNYDIVISTLPLTDSTRHMIDSQLLNKFRSNAMFINLSRGAVVDEKALTTFLKKREDVFAALDVFENEPLDINSELWSLPNVMITPHNSFMGENNSQRLSDLVFHNLRNFIR